jgi:predicted nucleic acid-binding protein
MSASECVLDCSVVAAFLLNEADGRTVDDMLRRAAAGEITLTVPALFWFELLNVLVVAERRGRLSRDGAGELRTAVSNLPVSTDAALNALALRRIHEFATTHGLSACDAAYLELADRLGARLRTFDPDLLALKPRYAWIE